LLITEKINAKTEQLRANLGNLLLSGFVLLLLCVPFQAHAYGISYNENGVKISLAKEVEDAIDGGISLTFSCEFAHVSRFLIFAWPEQIKQHKYVVTRHALSNRYLVHHEGRLAPRIFSSKYESMSFIANHSMDLFLKYHAQDKHGGEHHEMRLRLSKTELPGPLRLSAFITKEWDLDSGWNQWLSAP